MSQQSNAGDQPASRKSRQTKAADEKLATPGASLVLAVGSTLMLLGTLAFGGFFFGLVFGVVGVTGWVLGGQASWGVIFLGYMAYILGGTWSPPALPRIPTRGSTDE